VHSLVPCRAVRQAWLRPPTCANRVMFTCAGCRRSGGGSRRGDAALREAGDRLAEHRLVGADWLDQRTSRTTLRACGVGPRRLRGVWAARSSANGIRTSSNSLVACTHRRPQHPGRDPGQEGRLRRVLTAERVRMPSSVSTQFTRSQIHPIFAHAEVPICVAGGP
jgi:hypothetical protein